MADRITYLPRIADGELATLLRTSGAVQIKGPRWCGKTSTAERHSASQVYMQDPDRSADLLALADMQPSLLLEGNSPRLIDEWQMAPQLWDAVRFAVDRSGEPGRFILTGSSVPTVQPAHSGIGRISTLVMRTMALFESGESNSTVSLSTLFEGSQGIGAMSGLTVRDIAFVICRGGWPKAVLETDAQSALRHAYNYVDGLVNSDISRIDGVSRNATRVRRLIRSYARNVASQASIATIRADMQEDEGALAPNTVIDYIDALARAYVIEDLEAWNPALRSKTAIRTSPTRHFVDPSIAAATLRIAPERLLQDFELFGLLFESLCVRDLRVYAASIDGDIFHYRDKTDLEADAVIVLRDGKWAPVEIKLGNAGIDEAARHLLALKDRVDTAKMGAPSFLMVLTGTQAAYRRDDGVLVVPLGCLKP
ncbi:MAG: ATP-binding protein [Coriobacteriia bacterium]|nr:ATP-binding protein [Coriobacteriia bacterium]